MQFDRDELAFLSRTGRVPRTSRTGSAWRPPRERGRGLRRVVAATRRPVATARAFRTGVRATWTVFGAGQEE